MRSEGKHLDQELSRLNPVVIGDENPKSEDMHNALIKKPVDDIQLQVSFWFGFL